MFQLFYEKTTTRITEVEKSIYFKPYPPIHKKKPFEYFIVYKNKY